MGLGAEKIEKWPKKVKAGVHKSMKKERNRRIRRTAKTEKPNTKEYFGYEY